MDVLVIGGGLGGLTAALDLTARGHRVTVVEKKQYPFHRVCGEYVSNEVLPYLRRLHADPAVLHPAQITQFMVSSPAGRTLSVPLDMGGFGVSRFTLDHHLFQLAEARGVTVLQQTTVAAVAYHAATDTHITTFADGRTLTTRAVLGAYGKRSALDRQRPFFKARSPYLGVKHHLRLDYPTNLIALHNFPDGYAGISAVEDGRHCFCYLTTRQNLKQHGTIAAMEQNVLATNPLLRTILSEAEFLYPQPEVINEISFAPKSCLEDHVLLCGDAAGLITPLCGNGMAMALHGAQIASAHLHDFLQNRISRTTLETRYRHDWHTQFGRRLQVGRLVQGLFGKPVMSEAVVGSLRHWPGGVRALMRRTHGSEFGGPTK